MLGNEYRFKFYLNAVHSIEINNIRGMEHPHTWEIVINTFRLNESFAMFSGIEKKIEEWLSKYQNTILNQIPPFNNINPTLENIGLFISQELENLLVENGWILQRMEISETPTRSFIIDFSGDINKNDFYKPQSTELDMSDIFKSINSNIDESVLENIPPVKEPTLEAKTEVPAPEVSGQQEKPLGIKDIISDIPEFYSEKEEKPEESPLTRPPKHKVNPSLITFLITIATIIAIFAISYLIKFIPKIK